MVKEEAVWIKKTLREIDASFVKEVLDVGSSTREFRTQTQPYIDKDVFQPLRERGVSISYLDKKHSDGINYVCDIENITTENIGKSFDMVICCSLIEHVRHPKGVCSVLADLVRENGFLLITVPQSYRYHPDPIDTMFRPSMEEFISMFDGVEIIRKKVIRIRDGHKYKKGELIRYIIPFYNWKVNCLFMRKRKI